MKEKTKNRLKKILSVVGLVIMTVLIGTSIVVPSSAAVNEYNGKQYKYVGGSITVSSTPYVTSLPSGTTYTVNTGTRQYNQLRITTETRATGNSFEAYQSSTGTATALSVGDILYFDRDIRNLSLNVAWRDFIANCCEPVPTWSSDDSSPYASIYSTIGHYLFNDDYTNVPYGEYWVSGISILACLFTITLPFLIVFFIIRRL